jgi:hypothetical protein
MIYLHTKFHVPNYNGSFVIAMNLKTNINITQLPCCHFMSYKNRKYFKKSFSISEPYIKWPFSSSSTATILILLMIVYQNVLMLGGPSYMKFIEIFMNIHQLV